MTHRLLTANRLSESFYFLFGQLCKFLRLREGRCGSIMYNITTCHFTENIQVLVQIFSSSRSLHKLIVLWLGPYGSTCLTISNPSLYFPAVRMRTNERSPRPIAGCRFSIWIQAQLLREKKSNGGKKEKEKRKKEELDCFTHIGRQISMKTQKAFITPLLHNKPHTRTVSWFGFHYLFFLEDNLSCSLSPKSFFFWVNHFFLPCQSFRFETTCLLTRNAAKNISLCSTEGV